MKKISVMLAMTLLVSLIAGCGKGSDSQGAGETTLSIWYWGEQEVPGYKAYMEEMVKRYEEKNRILKWRQCFRKVIIFIQHSELPKLPQKDPIFSICGAEHRQWRMYGKGMLRR